MKIRHICLLLTGILVLSTFVVPAFACCRCRCYHKYTPGYWKHNVTVYVEDRNEKSYAADIHNVKESDASMLAYIGWIQSNIPGKDSFTLEDAYNIFWTKTAGWQEARQQLADWFNAAKHYS